MTKASNTLDVICLEKVSSTVTKVCRSPWDWVRRTRLSMSTRCSSITGLAQVNAIDLSQREVLAERGERYLKLRSLKLDLGIRWATAFGAGRRCDQSTGSIQHALDA
jgi:hypothetical protein